MSSSDSSTNDSPKLPVKTAVIPGTYKCEHGKLPDDSSHETLASKQKRLDQADLNAKLWEGETRKP